AAASLIHNAQCSPNPQYPLSLQEGVFRSTFAFCVFFRLFGDESFTGQESTQAYPPVRVRQASALVTAQQIITESWPIEVRESCAAGARNAVDEVERAFSLLSGEPMSVKGLHEATGRRGLEYINKLMFHRDTVTKPALEPYIYHDRYYKGLWKAGY